ncbi:tyrosine-type recombinase/integrase [Pandoraea sputorum]|uniref:tyrosine-type recombinase/integrase n=1 Tax=Pandoraea sputorum TaxID=93222 RepID=UPI00123FF658|nr:site-specific integrase [Pandoraea sputorum]VVE49609.1 integrase [Pandoraea sputorum]
MAKTVNNLSDTQIRSWVREGAAIAKADGDGLTFTLSASGTASWILRFRFGGRRQELTLGRYPDMPLSAARKEAAKRRLELQTGTNPAAERRKVKSRSEWTVKQLADDYRALVLPSLAINTTRGYERNLKRIEAAMGTLSVREVEASDIVGVLERHSALGWVEAAMLLTTVKNIFRHAAGKRLVNANPCTGVELTAIRGSRPEKKKRLMLDKDELHAVLTAEMSRENLLAVTILAGTGTRASELFTALRENVFLDDARWRIPKSKTGPEMDIPLSPIVVESFSELFSISPESEYVLPARAQRRLDAGGGDAHLSKDSIRAAIDFWIESHTPAVRRFTPHDLRSTMKSHMRALGVSRDISEMCLNHKLAGVEGVYDVHTYYSERRAALELWGRFLVACRDDKAWNVTPMKRARVNG